MRKIKFILFLFVLYPLSVNSQWQQLNGISPVWVKSLASNGSNIFAGNYILIGNENHNTGLGAWISTNNGLNWNITSLNIAPSSLHFRNSRLFACAGGLFYTDNNGLNWISVMPGTQMKVVSSNGSYVYCGGVSALYVSSNNGINWSVSLPGTSSALLVKDNYIFSADAASLNISSNNGLNWYTSSVNSKAVYSFATNGTNIFAGTNSGLYISYNNGTNWSLISPSNHWILSVLAFDSNIIYGDFWGNGIYKSTNLGLNWVQRNEGFNTNPSIEVLLNSNGYIFAGGSSGLYRRSIQNVLNIKSNFENITNNFSLYQNYPNPFNPTTNIKFKVASYKVVKLVVRDLLGREVQTLINEKLKPGEYEVTFNGSNLPSGVYFYKLQSGDFTETKKMLRVK